ncbi:MAG: hypothetical protein V3T86_01040 [Planctomycetota bacterium]
MRKQILAALSIAVVSLTAPAEAKTSSAEKALKKAEANILKGEKVLRKAAKQKSKNKRLRAMRPAKRYFAWARRDVERAAKKIKESDKAIRTELRTAHRCATVHLVVILNTETAHYLKRGSTSQARKANMQALALDPKNKRARHLQKAIAPANSRSGSSEPDDRVGRDSLATKRMLKRRTGTQTGKPTK